MHRSDNATTVKVWDPLIRAGHWLLVAAFFAAYFTEDELLDLHVWAGYTVGAIVVVRILWGFIGTRHARFSDFIASPLTAARYLLDHVRGRAARFIGHNPAGGLMILLLLAALAVTTWSGLMVYAYEERSGPLAPLVAEAKPTTQSAFVIAAAMADDDDAGGEEERKWFNEEREEFWEELHELFANLTLFLVILHVGGVVLTSFVDRENLVAAMLTGRKHTR